MLQHVLSSKEALYILLILGVLLCIICELLRILQAPLPALLQSNYRLDPLFITEKTISTHANVCPAAYALQRTSKRGDTVLLVGHNGAGKTTLFLQVAAH